MPSDPISYTCTCPASSPTTSDGAGRTGGTVLLFYRYFSAPPSLSSAFSSHASDPTALAKWHENLCDSLHLTGKIRVAKEGFNVTVAGLTPDIDRYVEACCGHWSFSGLGLESPESSPDDGKKDEEAREVESKRANRARDAFFKPTPGCACVFPELRVRVCAEITPLGVTNYIPSGHSWERVVALGPEEWHALLHASSRGERGAPMVLDVRNGYESRIGYFVTGDGTEALKPEMRRFSQWTGFVKRRLRPALEGVEGQDPMEGKERTPIATYCTGGIRCEKATRWMAETLGDQAADRDIYTLKGGIAAYLSWMDEEIRAGRKTAAESLWKGRNYVFDARGHVGLEVEGELEPVSECHSCHSPTSNLSKCGSEGCHLILVVCAACNAEDPRCCADCRQLDEDGGESTGSMRRAICECERAREQRLWGDSSKTNTKAQAGKATRPTVNLTPACINIPIQVIK